MKTEAMIMGQISQIVIFLTVLTIHAANIPVSASLEVNDPKSIERLRSYYEDNPNIIADSNSMYRYRDILNTTQWLNSNWMHANIDTLGGRTLLEITIPGTHDSGAYALSRNVMPGEMSSSGSNLFGLAEKLGISAYKLVIPWAISQDRDVYQQLRSGVRYIDFRCGWNGTEWVTFHMMQGNTCETLLRQIRKFLDEELGEIVVIEISHLANNPSSDNIENLASNVIKHLGPYLTPRSVGFAQNISTMIKKNYRAVVTLEASEVSQFPGLFYGETIFNTYANSCNKKTMMTYNDKQIQAFRNRSKQAQLFKVSWTLTPDADCIVKSVLPGDPHTLLALADTINEQTVLDPWAKKYDKYAYPSLANIVIIDHFESSHLVLLCSI